ncbi:two component system sensor kinase, hybrid [Planoprotostelium fungivorum]|uniref:histidine kinase n=1 Tax=Planoprotostelium fungivorum TaxID=1890364 RepID=A0A2P6NZM9_9EUKA|nr:two component system sensor kinase, hybrid [Planoprotostelium fungivorum]
MDLVVVGWKLNLRGFGALVATILRTLRVRIGATINLETEEAKKFERFSARSNNITDTSVEMKSTILRLKNRFVIEILSDTGRFFKCKTKQLLGASLSILLPEEAVPEAMGAYQTACDTQVTQAFYFRHDDAGADSLVEVHLIPLVEEKDILLSAKITKDHERASKFHLRDDLMTMYQSFEKIKEAIWILDAGGITTFANSTMAKLIGHDASSLMGRHLFEFVREDHQAKCAEMLQYFPVETIDCGRQNKFPFIDSSANEVWALVTCKPVIEKSGKRLGTFCVVRDVTEQERSGHALFDAAVSFAKQLEDSYDDRIKSGRKRSRTSFDECIQGLVNKGLVKSPSHHGAAAPRKLIRTEDREDVSQGGEGGMRTPKKEESNGSNSDTSYSGTPFRIDPSPNRFSLRNPESSRESLEDLSLMFFLELTEEGVWLFDLAGVTTFVNERMGGLLGWSPQEMMGKHISEFMDHDQSQRLSEENILRKQTTCEQHDFRMRKKDGTVMWMILSISPLKHNDVHLGAIAMDITARRQMEQEMLQTTAKLSNLLRIQTRYAEAQDRDRKKAEAADEAKTAFLANMSHEVRTPVNGIVGATELLSQSTLNEEQRGYVDIIKTSANNLLVVLNDILDFSRIESGQVGVDLAPFDLQQTVKHATQLFAGTAQKKGLLLETIVDPRIPTYIRGDSVKIHQVLTNLVSNALKFTAKGGVTIRVDFEFVTNQLRPEDDNPTPPQMDRLESQGNKSGFYCLLFSVKDTGIGIAEDKISQLFQRFYQVDSSITRQYGGTGLGLAISKRLVGLMGGEVNVVSSPQNGSCFWFRLALEASPVPLEQTPSITLSEEHEKIVMPAPVAVSTTEEREDKNSDEFKVLLAEDNPLNQKVATRMVEKIGYTVDVVSNGREALNAVKGLRYAVVLMDWQMPIMDGLASTMAIRKLEGAAAQIPIVALTAHSMPGDREKCLEAGCNAYLTKPIEFNKLSQVLKLWYSVGARKLTEKEDSV